MRGSKVKRRVVRRHSEKPASPPIRKEKRGQAAGSLPTRFAPGQSGNPSGRPKGSTRLTAVTNLWTLLEKGYPGNGHTYAEEMLRRIINSEHLLGKLIDKMLPTLTPEQNTLVINSFEARIAAIRAERGAMPQAIEGEGRDVTGQRGEGD